METFMGSWGRTKPRQPRIWPNQTKLAPTTRFGQITKPCDRILFLVSPSLFYIHIYIRL